MPIADAAPFEGQSATVVGYGRVALDCAASGERRRGSMEVHSFDEDVVTLQPSPATTCFGDSGGPVLVQSELGAPRLIGVVSTGSSTCDGQTIATRLDSACASWAELSGLCLAPEAP